MSEQKRRQRHETGMGMNQHMDTAPPGSGPIGTQVDTDLQTHIGRQLRAMYDTVVNQPVPDRFLELLNQLDKKTGEEKDSE